MLTELLHLVPYRGSDLERRRLCRLDVVDERRLAGIVEAYYEDSDLGGGSFGEREWEVK